VQFLALIRQVAGLHSCCRSQEGAAPEDDGAAQRLSCRSRIRTKASADVQSFMAGAVEFFSDMAGF